MYGAPTFLQMESSRYIAGSLYSGAHCVSMIDFRVVGSVSSVRVAPDIVVVMVCHVLFVMKAYSSRRGRRAL